MSELQDDLRSAYDGEGYDVDDVSVNRDTVRIRLRTASANAADLRTVAHDVVGEDAVLGLDVTTEAVDGSDEMATVVSFRHRPEG